MEGLVCEYLQSSIAFQFDETTTGSGGLGRTIANYVYAASKLDMPARTSQLTSFRPLWEGQYCERRRGQGIRYRSSGLMDEIVH